MQRQIRAYNFLEFISNSEKKWDAENAKIQWKKNNVGQWHVLEKFLELSQ